MSLPLSLTTPATRAAEPTSPAATPASAIDFDPARQQLAEAVTKVLEEGVLPGVSIAWIVDGQVVHAAGYGHADWTANKPAAADTIYRAGSISKLFNAVAAMQLVEQGKLDLDAPLAKALPEFSIVVPFENAGPITIRQLLCHRSGMIRESPVGGYLDPNQPTIPETVASVASCALVNPPNTRTRYSNVGPTLVGRAVEVQTGEAFGDYQQRHVLGPLGMTSSTWSMSKLPSSEKLRPRFAKGRMRVAKGDGTFFFEPAGEFELGTIPAGNLYTTVSDLAKFASFLMSGDATSEPTPGILKRASLDVMSTPQLMKDDTGFGLGFFVGKYREHKTVQHSGAVYGFSTLFVVMPRAKLGVVVLSNSDISMGPVRRLGDLSLDLLLAATRGEAAPKQPQEIELAPAVLEAFVGEFESPSHWAELKIENNKLVAKLSGQDIRLVPIGPNAFQGFGRMLERNPFEFERDASGHVIAFSAVGQHFAKISSATTPAAPAAWQAFVGSYGPSFIPLVVSVRHGHLYASVENEYDYRLTPLNRFTFNLSPGMYSDEQVVFQTDADGRVQGAVMANMYLPRR